HTRSKRDWSSDVCSSDLKHPQEEQAGDVEGEGRQGRESGIAQDARLEQEPSAAGIRETAQRQAADQGPHEGRRRDGAVGEGIPRSEERRVGKGGRGGGGT